MNIPTEELRDFVAEDEEQPEDRALPARPVARPAARLEGQGRAGRRRPRGAGRARSTSRRRSTRRRSSRTCATTAKAGRAGAASSSTSSPTSTACTTSTSRSTSTSHEQQLVEPDDPRRLAAGDDVLAEKEGLKGKVQTIYFDPPYGIKFGSNWQVSTRKRDVKDGKVEDATRQPEQIRAFRDTWELGIHSYLAYLRDRLVVARDLLTETGSIFVQIGDENVHLVRCVMDEVFGSENFVAHDHVQEDDWRKSDGLLAGNRRLPALVREDKEQLKYRQLYLREGGRYDDRRAVQHGSSCRRIAAAHDAEERETAILLRRVASTVADQLDLRARPEGADAVCSSSSSKAEVFTGLSSSWKTNRTAWSDCSWRSRLLCVGSTISATCGTSMTSRFADQQHLGRHGCRSASRDKVYVVQTITEGHRALPPHDHRPRRPRPRPDLRRRRRPRTSPSSGAGAGSRSTRAAWRWRSPARA